MSVHLIIDGDHISYRAASSCEPTKAKPYLEELEYALGRAEDIMQRIMYETNATSYELYIAGEGNWRLEIYPEYKANRKDKPKPTWLEEVREYLITKWKAEIVNGKEVDDMCGIRMTQLNAEML
jgi:5'-3' exonuclease